MDENSECNFEFWKEVEKEINEQIPELVKILLTKCGYDSRISLANIKLEDVCSIERYVTENQKELLKQMLTKQSAYSDLKINRGQFEFLPGHRKRIIAIGEMLASGREAVITNLKERVKLIEPLPNELSTELKNELCNSIVKWAKGKRLNNNVINDSWENAAFLRFIVHIIFCNIHR